MKKKYFLLGFFVTVILVLAAGAFCAKADFETVITEENGSTHKEAGLIAANTAKEYEIRYNGKRVISVKQTNADTSPCLFGTEEETHGYFSVEFEMTEDTSAYIAGLSKANKDEVQAKLLAAAYRDEAINLESLDFIDAEKVKSVTAGDDLLCWAAATSNVLWYTGWGREAGFESEDDLLDLFRDTFTDRGGYAEYAIPWFLNGHYPLQKREGMPHFKDNEHPGGYFPFYSAQKLLGIYGGMPECIRNATDALRRGEGICIAVDWLEGSKVDGAHAVTFWGYIYDNRYETERDANPEYIKAVILSDSDTDRVSDERRMSPNTLQVYNAVHYTEYGYNTFLLDTYNDGNGIIHSFVTLVPFGDDIEKETDGSATLDTKNTVDFTALGMITTCDNIKTNVFSAGDTISISPRVILNSDIPFSGEYEYTVTVNSQVYAHNESFSFEPGYIYIIDPIDISNLTPGEYEVRIALNPGKAFPEAHYYDNVYVGKIKVLGDAPDISGAKMEVSCGEQNGGNIDVFFEYENTDEIFEYLGDKYETSVAVSYYDDGKWTDWETITENVDCDASFPKIGAIETGYEKVKFMAYAEADGKPCFRLFSEEFDLDYIYFYVDEAEGNTGIYTKLSQNASSLADGEKFAFEVSNGSTYDADATFDLAVVAVPQYSQSIIILYEEKGLNLPFGAEPLLREVSTWDGGLTLSGRYSIYACISGEYGDDNVYLGSIEIKETPLTVVTTKEDVCDEYDGRTSLREAVAFCGEDDTVTLSGDLEYINLDSPIVIDKPVSINSLYEDNEGAVENPYGAPLGAMINAGNNCRAFEIKEGGSLELCGMAIMQGKAKDTGGAILLDGGTATLSQCRVFNCKSGRAGGGIYVKDGSLILKDSTFKLNESGYGGAIGSSDAGKIDMVNCTFFANSSNAGAVYTDGTFTAVNSTFEGNTAKTSGAAAVTAAGISDTTLINCIAPDTDALSSNVKVYGCILGDTQFAGDANGSRTGVSTASLFKTDAEGKALWTGYGGYRCIQYAALVSREAENGVTVINQDGKLALETGDGTLQTDITSAFSDEDLAFDAYGRERDGCCGSFNLKIDGAEMSLTDKNLFIYLYEDTDATLICAEYDERGNLIDIETFADTFKSGTNILNALSNAPSCKYMLWTGLDGLKPICPSVSR
ncbi:MAG: right-handed parallel beta-helix repeat-containing protein [Clostridia bacterium]|nr:right-handed parallel beta-helix repeat-containing protein [Clostridia bacterium]